MFYAAFISKKLIAIRLATSGSFTRRKALSASNASADTNTSLNVQLYSFYSPLVVMLVLKLIVLLIENLAFGFIKVKRICKSGD